MLYRQHQNNQIGANTGFLAILKRVKKLNSGWYGSQVNLLLALNGLSGEHLSLRFLLANALSLRRKPLHSLFLVFLRLIGWLKF